MMYSEKLVVALKHNGKILREKKDLVEIPFGSEFSVLVKNLNSRRVKFTLHIDGADALDGTEIIVNANSEVEMKRFIRNGNMSEGNAFKFIERTKEIEDGPRGIKSDDGLVRVEFTFEQAAPVVTKTTYIRDVYYDQIKREQPWERYTPRPFGDVWCSTGLSDSSGAAARSFIATSAVGSVSGSLSASDEAPVLKTDVGITVPGSKVEQKFTSVYGFVPEAQSHVIVLRLAGYHGDTAVTKPVTVDTKPKCVTCGKLNKATAKFCSQCGTSLTIL